MASRDAGLSVLVDERVRLWLDEHPDERAVLGQFVSCMANELAANDGKGNRPGWLEMDRKEALAEVHWHASKLAVAAKTAAEPIGRGDTILASDRIVRARHATCEYAADVANCALMVLDCMDMFAVPTREKEADHA